MINISKKYYCLIAILETVLSCANKLSMLDRIISVR